MLKNIVESKVRLKFKTPKKIISLLVILAVCYLRKSSDGSTLLKCSRHRWRGIRQSVYLHCFRVSRIAHAINVWCIDLSYSPFDHVRVF